MSFEEYFITQFTYFVGQYGYFAIGLLAFLECSLFVGLFVPGESFVIIGGLFANQGVLNVYAVTITVMISAYLGDVVGYFLGHRYGEQALLRVGKRFGYKQEYFDRAKDFFDRWGIWAIVIGRFMSIFRSLLPATIGTLKYSRFKFFLFDAIGVVLWTMTYVTLGYFLGESWKAYSGYFTAITIVTFILGSIVVYFIFKSRKKKEHQ